MAKEKITDEKLITRVRSEVTGSLGYMGDTISHQESKLWRITMVYPLVTR